MIIHNLYIYITTSFHLVSFLRNIQELPADKNETFPDIPLKHECYGTYMQMYIAKMMVPLEDPTHVYFREPTCVAHLYNATHFVMRTNYQFCGTTIVS